MWTIYKYPLELLTHQNIKIYEGSKILSVQINNGQITLWAEVETERNAVDIAIQIIGTGHELPTEKQNMRVFIGTVQIQNYVWHVYHLADWPF